MLPSRVLLRKIIIVVQPRTEAPAAQQTTDAAGLRKTAATVLTPRTGRAASLEPVGEMGIDRLCRRTAMLQNIKDEITRSLSIVPMVFTSM
jgi:hypothetical protein